MLKVCFIKNHLNLGYGIQMHHHNITEMFKIEYGTVDLHLLDPNEIKQINAGEVLNIPKGRKHALFAKSKNGFLLKETVAADSFVKRSIVWV